MRRRIIRPLLAWMTAATLASFNPEENIAARPDPDARTAKDRAVTSTDESYIAL
jgi:hypothetical protein